MFQERIKSLRLSLGINQIEFGRRLHVTKQCISNWENGNIMPSVDMLMQIASTFSISTDYLLGISDAHTISTEGLDAEQIYHIQAIIDAIRKK